MTRDVLEQRYFASISTISNLNMHYEYLIEDIFEISDLVFDDTMFCNVMDQVEQGLKELCTNPNIGQKLKGILSHFHKYCFTTSLQRPYYDEQDMRVLYIQNVFEVIAFGHRYDPNDFYDRKDNRASNRRKLN